MSTDDALTTPAESKNEMADVASPLNDAPLQANATRRRPRLNLGGLGGAGSERKRGKSMFGIVLGTLNKAKVEDKERNASEAAKKRQLIEQRLQLKLRKETDTVRRAEEAKKEKTLANRKEEDLQLKDSIYKLRRKRLPLLGNFLITTDIIPAEDSPSLLSADPLAPVPRTHPPPLYYLPAILTPAQGAFLSKRKLEVAEAAEKEWSLFKQERVAGIAEINEIRQKVTDEEVRQKAERDAMDTDALPNKPSESASSDLKEAEPSTIDPTPEHKDLAMDIDDGSSKSVERPESEKKDEPAMQADDDDAVEY